MLTQQGNPAYHTRRPQRRGSCVCTFAEGTSVKLTNNTFSATAAQVVLKSLPAGAADPGSSNPPFDFANEGGSGVNNIQGIAFGSNGDVVVGFQNISGANIAYLLG